jgi:hypothetical protein
MKLIEVGNLIFCSNQCLETYIEKMGRTKFHRKYIDVFEPGEGKGWVPKYSNEYIKMCFSCPKKLTDTCWGDMDLSATYHDAVVESEEYRWCCHARFCLSAALSDGTVTLKAGRKVQRYAENKAKEQNLRGVTTVTLSQSFGDLATNFAYKKLPENPPEVTRMTMNHFGACLLCDEPFGRQCEGLVEREFQLLDKAKSFVQGTWCGHTVNDLADILIDREDGEGVVEKIVPFADQVAKEKGHPGVITRDLFIALGRMI